jgi:hypothetical protein
MNIDTGLAVVIIAVLVFYLRLIVIQRQRAKRVAQAKKASQTEKKKGKKQAATPQPGYSIISKSNLDRAIAITGVFLIVLGVLLYTQIIPITSIQAYWWIPTSAGIVAFSWAFKL